MDAYDVYVDAALTNFSNVHKNGRLVADLVMPPFRVAKDSGKYLEMGKEEFHIDDGEDLILEDGEAKTMTIDGEWKDFVTTPRALKKFIPQRQLDLASPPWKVEKTVVEKLTNRLKLSLEYRVWQLALARSVADSQTTTPANNWNVAAGTPGLDIAAAKKTFREATGGLEATHMVMGASVADALCIHDDIIGKRAYTDKKVLSYGRQLPSPLFGLTPIVPEGQYNSADEGAAASYTAIWATDCYLLAIESPGLEYDGWGCQFYVGKRFKVRKWREEKRGYDGGLWIQVQLNQKEIEVNTLALWELKDLL